jgi:hypothetical protein
MKIQPYFVVVYDEWQVQNNEALIRQALLTEKAILADREYQLLYADGDGFLTYVEFDTPEEYVQFKLTYQQYGLSVYGYWFTAVNRTPSTVAIDLDMNKQLYPDSWLSWLRIFEYRNDQCVEVTIPRQDCERVLDGEYFARILSHGGRVVMKRHCDKDYLDGWFTWHILFPDDASAVMFRLS